jgi:hypothetical protein
MQLTRYGRWSVERNAATTDTRIDSQAISVLVRFVPYRFLYRQFAIVKDMIYINKRRRETSKNRRFIGINHEINHRVGNQGLCGGRFWSISNTAGQIFVKSELENLFSWYLSWIIYIAITKRRNRGIYWLEFRLWGPVIICGRFLGFT